MSALPYLAGLDFYSDDWTFLASFLTSGLEGPLQMLQSGLAKFPARPGHGILVASLIAAFGTDPLPFHLVNLAVCCAFVLLFYATLVAAGLDRATALAAAALFIVWPQVSTVRVWFAAFQIPLSGVFFLISMRIELYLAQSPGRHPVFKAASLAAIAASLSLYELFAVPTLLLAIFLGWRQLRNRAGGDLAGRLYRALPLVLNIALVLVALKLKAAASTRGSASLPTLRYLLEVFFQRVYDPFVDYGINLLTMLKFHFLAVPWSVLTAPDALVAGPWDPVAVSAAVAVGLMTGWRLFRSGDAPRTARQTLGLLAGGMVAFFAGYAIFLVSQAVTFSLGGIGNRTAFAATIGVVLVLAGLLRGLSFGLGRYRKPAFALAVAGVAALATLRSAEIGTYWAKADDVRRARLATAAEDLAGVSDDAVVLIDGICPYLGPAIVIEADWEATGIMQLLLGRPLTADTTARIEFGDEAADSSIYGSVTRSYRYGPTLFLYNAWNRRLDQLTDAATVRAVLARPDRFAEPCPKGHAGHGAPFGAGATYSK